MALDRTRWRAQFAAVGEYLAGSDPLLLTPVAGGDAIAYRHDEESRGMDGETAGPRASDLLVVYTATALNVAASYTTEDGRAWTVEECKPVQGGTFTHTYRSALVSHAR